MPDYEKIEDCREELREAIFNVIEYLIQYSLTDTARQLILYYFNESRGGSSRERAYIAIEKYYGETLPPEEERNSRFTTLLNKMELAADAWDNE